MPDDQQQSVTPKALAALRVLVNATKHDPLPAKAIARRLWPERMKECGTSLSRGGMYRAAGAYCSKLQRQGLVGFYMDDYQQGYYLTEIGRRVVASAALERAP